MKTITLSNGFTFDADPVVLNNMELIEALATMKNDEDALQIAKVAMALFGKNKNAIYNSLREDDGRVPIESTVQAIMDTFSQLGDNGKK